MIENRLPNTSILKLDKHKNNFYKTKNSDVNYFLFKANYSNKFKIQNKPQ